MKIVLGQRSMVISSEFITFAEIFYEKIPLRNPSFLILFLFLPFVCLSQQSSSYYFPDYYSSTSLDHTALINPAWTHSDSKASLNTLYKSKTGLLSEVASLTAYADVAIGQTKGINQVARIMFMNEQEGPYISSPRFYGNYSVKVPIREDVSLSAGLALGISSLSFTAPSGMGRGSSPDGTAGLIFKYRKSEIGAASYQIFNSEVNAVSSNLTFKRFYQCYMQSEKDLTEYLALRGQLFWRTQPLNDFVNGSVFLVYKEIITFGGMYQLRRGTSFLTSLQINKSKKPIIINCSYNSLFLSSLLLSSRSFEVGLVYRIYQ